jgi:hypothetical protein
MRGGLVAIRQTIRGGVAGALVRLGSVAAVVGVTIDLILVHLDGVGAYQLAQEWAESSSDERSLALGLVHANETINFALASLFKLVFAGVTFILFGLAVLLSEVHPRWLAWTVLLAGVFSSRRWRHPSRGRGADGRLSSPDDHRSHRHHDLAADHGSPVVADVARRSRAPVSGWPDVVESDSADATGPQGRGRRTGGRDPAHAARRGR